MNSIRRFDDLVNRLCQYFSALLLAVISVVCALQVFYRHVLNNSLSWSEELMRYLFIWMVLIATTITVKHGSGASVDSLAGIFRRFNARLYTVVLHLLMAAGGVVFVVYGWKISMNTMSSLTAALQVPMGLVYLCVPISGAIITLHCLTAILDALLSKKEAQDE